MDEEPQPDTSESGTLEGNPGNLSTQPNQNAYQQTVAYAVSYTHLRAHETR